MLGVASSLRSRTHQFDLRVIAVALKQVLKHCAHGERVALVAPVHVEEIGHVAGRAATPLRLETDASHGQVAAGVPRLGARVLRIVAIANVASLGNVGDGVGLAGVIGQRQLQHRKCVLVPQRVEFTLLLGKALVLEGLANLIGGHPQRGSIHVVTEEELLGAQGGLDVRVECFLAHHLNPTADLRRHRVGKGRAHRHRLLAKVEAQ